MKRITSVLFALLLVFAFLVPAAAQNVIPDHRTAPYLADNADILTDAEEKRLLGILTAASEKSKMDIVVLTETSTGYLSAEEYADDYYDYNGFGTGKNRDGVLMLITTEPRYVHISGCGKCETIFNSEAIDSLIDTFYYEMQNDQFGDACELFASNASERISSFRMRPFILIVVALGVGFLIAGVIVNGMKKKLDSVARKVGASDYTVGSSLKLTQSNDLFLYNNITRVRIATENARSGGGGGSHTSSSGTSHSGGGRSF